MAALDSNFRGDVNPLWVLVRILQEISNLLDPNPKIGSWHLGYLLKRADIYLQQIYSASKTRAVTTTETVAQEGWEVIVMPQGLKA